MELQQPFEFALWTKPGSENTVATGIRTVRTLLLAVINDQDVA